MPVGHLVVDGSRHPRAASARGRCARLFVCLVLLPLLSGCRGQDEQPALPAAAQQGRQTVFVSILPLAYFAERLGQEQVTVEVLVGPGQAPGSYEPSPRQLARLARAALLFRIGAPFERTLLPRLQRISSALTIVDTRRGIELLYGTSACGDEHEADAHDQKHDHDHDHDQKHEQEPHHDLKHAHAAAPPRGAADPHIWLDPRRALLIARTMAAALADHDPAHAPLYRARLQQLERDLTALDAELAQLLAPLAGQRLFVYHGAYGYFCQRYRLEQVALEEGGKEGGARQLARFIELARQAGARALFVQPQYSRREAEAVARSIKAEVITLDPLSRRYLQDLRTLAQTVRAKLAAQAKPPAGQTAVTR